jgi:hypothetical protein
MWLWFGITPFSWFFGMPLLGTFNPAFGTAFLFATPTLQLCVAMVVVFAGMGLLARRALNY